MRLPRFVYCAFPPFISGENLSLQPAAAAGRVRARVYRALWPSWPAQVAFHTSQEHKRYADKSRHTDARAPLISVPEVRPREVGVWAEVVMREERAGKR